MTEMYSLAIVDDEPAIRNGLTRHIDWESLGFRVVDSFEDGEDALAYLRENHVDVVLTDIRMSVVSGLTLAQTIHDREIPTEVVLLTGYKEFEYARRAMRAGVRHYLLKPTQREEIHRVFSELRRHLSERTNDRTGFRALVREVRRRLLVRLVEGLVPDDRSLAAEWRKALLPPLGNGTTVAYALLKAPEAGDYVDLLCVDDEQRKTIALLEPPDLLHFLVILRAPTHDPSRGRAVGICRQLLADRIAGGRSLIEGVLSEAELSDLADLREVARRKRGDQLPRQSAVNDVSVRLLEADSKDEVDRAVRAFLGAAPD
jgi:FixJ family two-component response regulator